MVTEAIPDLWRRKENASRLYNLYLARLQVAGSPERIVAVCPQIRRYASRGPGAIEGAFTFDFEIDALCDLEDYKTAWRRLRRREVIVFGERFDLRRRKWSKIEGYELGSLYAPLLYYLGRYSQGCALLDAFFNFCFDGKKADSYYLLNRVYNGDEEPWHRCRVTLSHFYGRLGKSLSEWRHWEAFVKGFHPQLFRLSAIRHGELLANPGQLPAFFDRLRDLRDSPDFKLRRPKLRRPAEVGQASRTDNC